MENKFKFRHFDKKYKEMRFSNIHYDEFYIDAKGVLYKYFHTPTKKNYESYEIDIFSGSLDKNGVEIFEGDIISYEDGSIFEVVYMRGAFGYISDISSDFITLNETNLSIAEVVGNVYQKK